MPPLTLADMRSQGVRFVDLQCECGHDAIVNVDRLPDDMPVPNVRDYYRCHKCKRRPWRSMPNWSSGPAAPGVPDTRAKPRPR